MVKKKEAKCPYCETIYKSKYWLDKHIAKVHEKTPSAAIITEQPEQEKDPALSKKISLPKINFTGFFSTGLLRWVVLAIVAGILIKVLIDSHNRKKIEENNTVIAVETKKQDSLERYRQDSILTENKVLTQAVQEAQELLLEAEKDRQKKQIDYTGAKREAQQNLETIKNTSNETRKIFENNPTIRALDSIVDYINRTGKYKQIQ